MSEKAVTPQTINAARAIKHKKTDRLNCLAIIQGAA